MITDMVCKDFAQCRGLFALNGLAKITNGEMIFSNFTR